MNYRNVHGGAARLGADVSGSGGWVLIRSLMWLSTNWNASQAMGTEEREREKEKDNTTWARLPDLCWVIQAVVKKTWQTFKYTGKYSLLSSFQNNGGLWPKIGSLVITLSEQTCKEETMLNLNHEKFNHILI